MTNPAAWHPDPTGAHEYRWWDGTRWTEHVADAGQASIAPLAGGPGPDESTAASATPDSDTADRGEPGAQDQWSTEERSGDASSGWHQPEASETETTAEQPAQSWQQPASPAGGGGPPPTWGEQPQSWSQPAATAPASSGTNGVAIAAMVIGIVSLLFCWIPFLGLLGGLGGIVALILGFIGRSKAKSAGTGGQGAALTGIITGILALLVSIAVTVAVFSFGGAVFGDFAECVESGRSPEQCQEELEDDLTGRFGG